MRELTIRVRSFEDVQKLCQLSDELCIRASLSDGHRCVDIRSMMQMFSLNLQEELLLQISCSDDSFHSIYPVLEHMEVK